MLIPHIPLEWMSFYNEGKFWGAVLTFTFAGYKIFQRVLDVVDKDIPTLNKNIIEVKQMLGEQTATIVTGFKDQTNAVVGELKEQRQDFRTFFVPPMMARAERIPRPRKPKAKGL